MCVNYLIILIFPQNPNDRISLYLETALLSTILMFVLHLCTYILKKLKLLLLLYNIVVCTRVPAGRIKSERVTF